MTDGVNIDNLVLGTVNAPWKRSLDADTLTRIVVRGDVEDWLPQVATFYTEVNPRLVLAFARTHDIPLDALARTYARIKVLTGETNENLDAAFAGLGKAA